MSITFRYIAENEGEFEELKKSKDLFFKDYSINTEDVTEINVKRGALEKTVDFFPKVGKIKNVGTSTEKPTPPGILRNCSPHHCVIEIGEYRFFIRYNPETIPQ